MLAAFFVLDGLSFGLTGKPFCITFVYRNIRRNKEANMTKVKTFMSALKVFHTARELEALDEEVNKFVQEKNVATIISVNDTCTTDENGATIGIIRVIAYKES
jgi:hypothetical protein